MNSKGGVMLFQQRLNVMHEALQPGVKDRQGNPVKRFGEPVSRPVVTWYPPGQDEVIREERTGFVDVLYILTLDKWGGHGDRVTIDRVTFTMQGEPEDYTHHPWGFHGGYRLRVERQVG